MSQLSNRDGLTGNVADVVVLTVTEFGSLAARCLLAATFLIAGAAKLANRRASIQSLRDFGTPLVAQPLIPLLAPVEITIAAAFLFAASAWYAAWVAAALLLVFIVGIAAKLARGQRPPCNCFGQLHSKPIGWRTLARNGGLAACATGIIVHGPPQPAADLWVWLSRLDTHGRQVALVFAAVIGVTMMHALRQEEEQGDEEPDAEPPFVDEAAATQYRSAPIASRTEAPRSTAASQVPVLTGNGLAIGTSAPGFTIPDLEGHPHSLDSLRASGKPVLLVFSSPHCASCQALVPKLPSLTALHHDAFRIILISRGSVQQNLNKVKNPDTLLVLLQQDAEVTEAYDCTSMPAAVVVDADGVIQSQLAVGELAIAQLLSSRSQR